jgi:hypothetical protein
VDITIQRIEYAGDRIRENWIIPETVNDPKKLSPKRLLTAGRSRSLNNTPAEIQQAGCSKSDR